MDFIAKDINQILQLGWSFSISPFNFPCNNIVLLRFSYERFQPLLAFGLPVQRICTKSHGTAVAVAVAGSLK